MGIDKARLNLPIAACAVALCIFVACTGCGSEQQNSTPNNSSNSEVLTERVQEVQKELEPSEKTEMPATQEEQSSVVEDPVPIDLEDPTQHEALNRFLSNFSEVASFTSYDDTEELDRNIINFLYMHAKYNNGANVLELVDDSSHAFSADIGSAYRIKTSVLEEYAQRYLKRNLDLAGYEDNTCAVEQEYAYFVAADGQMPSGVTYATSVKSAGGEKFEVVFSVYEPNPSVVDMDYDVLDADLYAYTLEELQERFGTDTPSRKGTAILELHDDGRNAPFKLCSYSIS